MLLWARPRSAAGTCVPLDPTNLTLRARALNPLQAFPDLPVLALVGDPNQLPSTVKSPTALKLGLGRSLMDRLCKLGMAMHMLNTQYRMHPHISLWPSRAFYNAQVRLIEVGRRGRSKREGETFAPPPKALAARPLPCPQLLDSDRVLEPMRCGHLAFLPLFQALGAYRVVHVGGGAGEEMTASSSSSTGAATTGGGGARSGTRVNRAEAELVARAVRALVAQFQSRRLPLPWQHLGAQHLGPQQGEPPFTIGVISPYNGQVRELWRAGVLACVRVWGDSRLFFFLDASARAAGQLELGASEVGPSVNGHA